MLAAKSPGFPMPRSDVVPGKPHIVKVWGRWRTSASKRTRLGMPLDCTRHQYEDAVGLQVLADVAVNHMNLMGFWPSKTPHRLLQGVVRAPD